MAICFAMILLDDMLMVHEKAGRRLMAAWPGLPRADTGELYIFAMMGLATLALLMAGFRRTEAAWRWRAGVFLLPFGMTIMFGIGLDALSALLRPGMNPETMQRSMFVFNLVEEAGEMVAASLAVACAVALHSAHVTRHAAAETPRRPAHSPEASTRTAA